MKINQTRRTTILATRWSRFFAHIVDVIITSIPVVIAILLTIHLSYSSLKEFTNRDPSFVEQAYYVALSLVGYLFINGHLLHKKGQTVGKWLLGIQIVSYRTNQILPLWKVFAIRYLPQFIIGLLPVVGFWIEITNVLFIFGKERRCLHDYLAKTKVIRVRQTNW